MSALANLSREERLGLGIAVAAHVALVAGLMLQPGKRDAMPVPDRMTVSLADEVSLQSTSPDPATDAAAAVAPVLAPESEPAPVIEPQPAAERPVPQPVEPPRPRVQPKPQPKPTPAPKQQAKSKPQPTQAPARPKPAGGSRIGDDFLKGTSDGDRAADRGSVAAAFGPAEAASLNSAIARQIKPHWSAPSGVDAEELVTMVRFRLNRDGTLAGSPDCVSQSGVTASNAAQKGLHCERAIRAIRLAAPFDLPDQFYDKWKLVTSRFDRRL